MRNNIAQIKMSGWDDPNKKIGIGNKSMILLGYGIGHILLAIISVAKTLKGQILKFYKFDQYLN